MYLGLSDQFKGQWPWPICYLLFKVKICHIITTTPTGRGPRVTAPCCIKGHLLNRAITYIPLIEWVEKVSNSTLKRFLLKTSFHCLPSFTVVTFMIQWPLSLAASCVYWCQSCFVCSGFTCEIYSGSGPITYMNCVVGYRVIAAPCVRSIGCVFAHLYTLVDDLECRWTMGSFYYQMIF